MHQRLTCALSPCVGRHESRLGPGGTCRPFETLRAPLHDPPPAPHAGNF